MLPLPNKDEASEARPGRVLPCLFPTSNITKTGEGEDSPISRAHLRLVLKEQWSEIEPSLTSLGIRFPAMLKAAWLLTLRCFVSVENICFGYQEQIFAGSFADHRVGHEDMRTSSKLIFYIVRVECGEAIQHILQRLEKGRKSPDLAAPTVNEIRVVEAQSSHHFCNTAIHYHDHNHEKEHEHEHKHGELQTKHSSDSVVSLSGRLGMNKLK